ncbi:MAG: hypothetical protein OEX03_04115 [Gammaproteobacteria bacterium]|nr:hypothetical protein [Gammaproteobacteria bacterium]
MAEIPEKVEQGDLILASQMNEIVDYLIELNTRVSVLESGGWIGASIKILGLSPSEDIHMGQELRVYGTGFGIPALNVLSIEMVKISSFKPGSNSNLLIFDIPPILGLPSTGKEVTLSVSGPNGFDAYKFWLNPPALEGPDGTLMVRYIEAPSVPEIIAPDSYEFVFSVQAIVNMNETYDVQLTINGDEAGWNAVLIDDSDVAIVPPKIFIDVGSPPQITTVDFTVRVDVPDVATQATLDVRVVSERNKIIVGEKKGLLIKEGFAPPAPGPITVFLNPRDILSPGAVINGVLKVPAASLISTPFQVLLVNPGDYTAGSLVIEGDPEGRWSAQYFTMTETVVFTTTRDNQIFFPLTVGISAAAGAPDATLVLTVTSNSDPSVTDELRQSLSLA